MKNSIEFGLNFVLLAVQKPLCYTFRIRAAGHGGLREENDYDNDNTKGLYSDCDSGLSGNGALHRLPLFEAE